MTHPRLAFREKRPKGAGAAASNKCKMICQHNVGARQTNKVRNKSEKQTELYKEP